MSTLQHNQLNSFSPILLSPSSTTITNHITLFDNSDQGSVDSDYTSLGSSKFYGNSGSTSSLHRQGRSHSIDELASTTTIPTRHFNGTLNVNKSNNDPLQFVKIHPNHELIERAQEQLCLAESRKRLQENYTLTHHSNDNKTNDEEVDWSKAVDSWRQKREQKRVKNVNSTDDNRPLSPIKVESIPKLDVSKKLINETVSKPLCTVPSPPIEKTKSKSPSPMRNKGPSKIHEISIQRPLDIRGFGFKLDGGRTQNRPIFVSTIEEGSPADKAGLCIDDEILSINDENVENITYDQVRKILKERNIRGSIKMTVRTYEDIIDDNSQTVSTGFTTDHSRTPSPQKPLLTTRTTSPPIYTPITKTNTTPSPTGKPLSPVYTFLPYDSSSTDINESPSVQPAVSSSLNIFAPKPFRSTASINLDTQNSQESNMNYISPIEAFRRMLESSNTTKHAENENICGKELEDLEIELDKQLRESDAKKKRETTTTNEKQQTNSIKFPAPRVLIDASEIAMERPPPLQPISSLNVVLQGNSTTDSNIKPQQQQQHQLCKNPDIAQVRSYVEKQMDQLQQDLEFGFSRTPKVPPSSSTSVFSTTPAASDLQQQPVNVPIDLTYASSSQPDFLRSSLKKSVSTQNELDQIPPNRTYGVKINPKEQVIHYLDPYSQQKSSLNYAKRSIPDLPSMTTVNRPSTAHSIERTINELRIDLPGPYSSQPQTINQQQKKVTIQVGDIGSSQRMTSKLLHTTLNQAPRKTQVEDHTWITNDQRKAIHKRSHSHRSTPTTSHHQELHMGRPSTTHYHDQYTKSGSEKTFDLSPNKQHRTRSPGRTMNNERVLSVSGKLRCSRCDEELGHGSAMVIESLGLYYHIECFHCCVCNTPLSSSPGGVDVRVRSSRLHCQNCFSDENGKKKCTNIFVVNI
ncbi:hypothetical protein I4U23_002378 [Adineta vaga]|nr:hypothetical protein I4U23_002378 [Adineta vaga]